MKQEVTLKWEVLRAKKASVYTRTNCSSFRKWRTLQDSKDNVNIKQIPLERRVSCCQKIYYPCIACQQYRDSN